MTAEIADRCVSHLFIFSKRAEIACELSAVGDNRRTMHFAAGVVTRGARGWKWTLVMSACSNPTESLLAYFKIIIKISHIAQIQMI